MTRYRLSPDRALRILLVGALSALALVVVTAEPKQNSRGGVVLASSSLSAAPSPATTIVSPSTSIPASPPTTVPVAHTGEPWGSTWFIALLASGVVLGGACLNPTIGRRRKARRQPAR